MVGKDQMRERPAPQRSIVVDGKVLPELLDEATIEAVVHGFYDRIRKDELLGPIFSKAIAPDEWPRHLAKMCDFWSATLLRTGRYNGRPLPAHIAVPGLEEVHFRRWLGLFRETVQELCTPDVAALFMSRALRVAHSFRLGIAFHRGEDSLSVEPIREETL